MHGKLLALPAANFEDPDMLVLEHDFVSYRVYFGGVWSPVHGLPSLDVFTGEFMCCPQRV